ncbi:MAG: triphosphoribosyl-dephospho-CoA synthase CitG [Clostridia bacterium]|nr:triphosphoribosyl-dephospho-CoA synthase CitG [Clostridia bacterium]
MHKNYHEHVAMLASKAILYEVATSPKPGLVDRFNNGAHTDMDFFTFMASSSALNKGFMEIAQAADTYSGEAEHLLSLLRPIGLEMEKAMFAATDQVNTHKGIVFSLGILVAATIQVSKNELPTSDAVIAYVKRMTSGLTQELISSEEKKDKTSGEKIFKTYGLTGIRGEVESGFQTVQKYGLDVLKKSYYTLGNKNDLFIHVLFSLMTACEDSNIISRHEPETLYEVQAMAKDFIHSGGMKQQNSIEQVKELDRIFTERNISPGGSADLLAVTIFFGLVENLIS